MSAYGAPIKTRSFLLNSAVLTAYGQFKYTPLTEEEARDLFTYVGRDGKRRLKEDVVSAIGHEATAKALSLLFGVQVPCERRQITMEYIGDRALVVRFTFRLPEGYVVKSLAELEEMNQGYNPIEMGLLEKVK